jgi:hypothetical protein
MAARLSIVSSSDSPLVVDEAAMFRLMTSADRRFEAHLLDLAVGNAHEARCGVEDVVDDGLGQSFDSEKVLQLAVLVELRVMHCRLRS